MSEWTSTSFPERGPQCPPVTFLESLAVGEEERAGLAEHARGCSACRQYVERLQSEQAAFLSQQSAERFLDQLGTRKAPSRWALFQTPVLAVAGLAASAAVAAFLVLSPSVVFKGGTFEVVYKRSGMSQPRPVTADLQLRKGDALRFSYQAQKDGYLMILEVDANGKVTSFYPLHGTRSDPIRSGRAHFLPGSVVLDNSPGPEWLIAIFSARPLQLESLEPSLRASSALVAPTPPCGDCQIETLRIQKER